MPKKTRAASTAGNKPRRRRLVLVLLALTAGAIGAAAWLVLPFWQLAGQFGSAPSRQPSRLYGRAPALAVGERLTVEALGARLASLRYAPALDSEPLVAGRYRVTGGTVAIARRRFPTVNGPAGGDRLEVTIAGGVVRRLALAGHDARQALLDPPLIASYYGDDLRERRPVAIDQVAEDLVYAVLAVEDTAFLEHRGLSLSGMLRAAWVNLREGGVRQGGSTLTQQLVKNLYLSHDRTLVRKTREALLAILIELRFEKRAILEAYLNEIYWGRSGSVDLMGVGAAAWAYFGKDPAQLTLAEAATLAGMIRSPGSYSPLTQPQQARRQRNRVLTRLGELRWVDQERLEQAARVPLDARPRPLVARRAPFFADAMAAEARRRFQLGELRDAGYVLLSTLSLDDQRHAEAAVERGLNELEKGWEKGRAGRSSLEAAVISVDPGDGGIRAYVGGRDYGSSQFDRVAAAHRQAGSAFKPIVYAAAYAGGATPATRLHDAPFTHTLDGKAWSPQNSDGTYHGWVTTRVALENSYNVPTAQLGLATGLNTIVELARRMGIESRFEPWPSITLGAVEVAPRELATVYATLAAGGLRPTLHGLEAVFDRTGRAVVGQPVPAPQRVLGADVAYLVTHVLQGVLDVGTAKEARRLGLDDRLAGKTGTTNSRRDSWFAGYAPGRATLVWVGYDDNADTHLSGARAALPIWARFTRAVRPAGGYRELPVPDGVVWLRIDPETGALATERCPLAVNELFRAGQAPAELCPEHGRRRNRFRRWLDRVNRRRGGG